MRLDLLALDWQVVPDTVMGGVSSGEVARVEGGVRFSGELSLAQGGGFVSVRTAPADLDLGGTRGLAITVRGDARTWWFTARRDDVPIRAGSYRAEVEVAPAARTVTLSWADFAPMSRGRPVSGVPPLADGTERIDSLGLLLADGQPGPFEIELRAVEALPRR